jgi:hypothetical protein
MAKALQDTGQYRNLEQTGLLGVNCEFDRHVPIERCRRAKISEA